MDIVETEDTVICFTKVMVCSNSINFPVVLVAIDSGVDSGVVFIAIELVFSSKDQIRIIYQSEFNTVIID